MPAAIRVANCREKTAISRPLMPRKRLTRLSRRNGSRCSETSSTISPRSRSCSVPCALVSASSSPREGIPATSTALKANVVMVAGLGGGHRLGLGHRLSLALGLGHRSEQALQLLRHRGTLLGQLAADLVAAHELGEM